MSDIIDWVRRNIVLVIGLVIFALPTMRYVSQTSWATEQGAHGPIVLATGIWLLWRRWHVAAPVAQPAPINRVLMLLIPLLILFFVARISQIVEIEGYVMYAVLLVALYSQVGRAAMERMWFPLFYLAFMFPPPDRIVWAITQPLKIGISEAAVSMLYALGYPVGGSGVTIQIDQYQLLVAQACSGLNSIISLSAISLFYIYTRHEANWRYAMMMFLAVLPVAIFANFVRVIILILLTYYGGEAAAQGFLHNFAGLTMFVTALLTIFLIDSIAEPIWTRRQQRKQAKLAKQGTGA